ncbi:hypothetical protein B296_00051073 [Ensete ventricosum]|uniref:Uncharacterized protein n=1 Tax=Ensete ventricosum TaxID=4639 RepID=A0A426YIE7_ENSVE|nr:hypothetical protein B296_00051073 [Ensete ventricosum]
MVLTVSRVLVKGSDRARWGGLLNDRKSCAKLTKTYPVLCRRRRELRGTCTLSRRSDEGTKATQLAEEKLGSEGFDTGQEDVEVGTLEEYRVDEDRLPKERTQSEVAEALRCASRGHI